MKKNTPFFFTPPASFASPKDYSGYSTLHAGNITSDADITLIHRLVVQEATQLKPIDGRPVRTRWELHLADSPEMRTAVSAMPEPSGMSAELALEELSGLMVAERGRGTARMDFFFTFHGSPCRNDHTVGTVC